MMMLKAFQDVVGRDNFERLTVQYSLDRGYYCELVSDTAVTKSLLDKVKTRMMEIQQAKMPTSRNLCRSGKQLKCSENIKCTTK